MSGEGSFRLRLAGPGDDEALALVGAASFLESFAGVLAGADVLAHCRVQHAREKYAGWIGSSEAQICMAEMKAAPIGYAVLTAPDLPLTIGPGDIELKRIYLLHRFQGTGLGRALMEWSLTTAQTLGKTRLLLAVYAQNARAIAFYARCGFKQVGTREFHVGYSVYHDLVFGLEL